MAQVMEPEAGQAGCFPQRPSGDLPFLPWVRRVVLVVLIRAPEVMLSVRMSEFVCPFEHPRDGIARRAVQRDPTLARFVLAVPDVQHSLTDGALDVPRLIKI